MAEDDMKAGSLASGFRLAAACVGAAAGVPWWPVFSALARSYVTGDFPSPADQAVLLTFFFAMGAVFLAFLVCGDALDGVRTPLCLALVGAASVLVCYGIACIPSEVDGLLRIAGAVFAGGSTACLVLVWSSMMRGASAGEKLAEAAVVSGCAGVLVWLGFCLDAPQVLAGSACLVVLSFALAFFLSGRLSKGSQTVPSQAPRLFFTMRARLRTRLFAAGALVAFAFSAMLCRYFAATYDRVPNAVFLAGCGGVVLLLVIGLVVAGMCHEINSAAVFRLSMVAAVAAFFPMDPGSWFSIVFALICTLLALFAVMGSFALLIADASACTDFEDQKTLCCGWVGIASGAVVGCVAGFLGHASLEVNTSGQSAIGISLLGLAAIVCTFVATSVLVDRDTLRDLKFLSVGKLPVSYTLYEKEREPHVLEDLGLLACCKELALSGGLTQRESEVLIILARGSSLAKVQEELFISQGTAITHRNNIYRKLDIHSRQELLDHIDALRTRP